MKRFKVAQMVCALVLAVAWGAYAVASFMQNIPAFASAYRRSWNLSTQVEAMLEAANSYMAWQNSLQNANGRITQALRHRTVRNMTIVRGSNGQLLYANYYPYELYDYTDAALQMQQLMQAAQRQNAPLLYVNCADAYSEADNTFDGLPAIDLNPRSDAFLNALRGYGVPYLDTREVLQGSGLLPQELFYKTEPHWTTQAAFAVYVSLAEKIAAAGEGWNPGGFYTSERQFTHTAYPGQYLGKLGKIAGAPYAGYDDFTLIAPAFETLYTMEFAQSAQQAPVQGNFDTVLLDSRWLDGAPYDSDMYSAYLTDVYPYRKITNHLNPEGPRVLLVGDSYMLPVASFLSTMAGEIHLFSCYGLPWDMPALPQYLAENDVDYVVVGMNPNALYGDGFSFLNGIEVPALPAPIPPPANA